MGVIVVDGSPLTVGDGDGSIVNVRYAVNKTWLCNRNKGESDAIMQDRAQRKVNELRAVRPPSAASVWRIVSPGARLTERVRAGDRR